MVGVILLHVKQWLMQQMQEGQPAAGMKMPWCHIDNLCEVQVGCSRGGDPPPSSAYPTACTSSVYRRFPCSMMTHAVPCCKLLAAFLHLLRPPQLPVHISMVTPLMPSCRMWAACIRWRVRARWNHCGAAWQQVQT